jgi:sugar phosphate isomerase/epimerase
MLPATVLKSYFKEVYTMQIGAQLYTVRDFCKTKKKFAETLEKVADIGYKTVQVSGTCAYEGEWLAEALKEAGLTCDLTHYSFDEMIADTKAVVEKHKKFGCKYIGIGCMPRSTEVDNKEVWKEFTDKALPVAKAMSENGAYLMYHKHAFEFKNVDGECVWDHITNTIPAEIMGLTVDTHWVATGERDIIETLKSVKNRIPCVHFKDSEVHLDELRMAPVGFGNMDVEGCLRAAEEAGTEYFLVEQDKCNGIDPFLCLKHAYKCLSSYGYK